MTDYFVGITKTASGYSLSFIRLDEKTAHFYDRLTMEGVRCLIEQNGFVEPIFISDKLKASIHGVRGNGAILPFLGRDQVVDVRCVGGYGPTPDGGDEIAFHKQVLREAASSLGVDSSDFRYTHTISHSHGNSNDASSTAQRIPLPIYSSTAQQIGLLDNPNVPK